jgi:nucleotide-binding universal stress UspA family protein
MPIILTATDYSDTANHAVRYACNMAQAYSASVTVVHSFIIPVVISTDTPMPAISIEEARSISVERMDELIAGLKTEYPGIEINSHITYGDITDSLQEYTESTPPWLIVIGNSSSEDTNFWPGSNLINALKELPVMVLAVPSDATYKPVTNICFACDFKNTSEQIPAENLLKIVHDTGAKLHVLNVHKNNSNEGELNTEADALKAILATASPEYHFISSDNVDERIQQFVTENNMDWLVIIPHKHSFFEGLLHRSHTKAMARMTHIPLMAMHERSAK